MKGMAKNKDLGHSKSKNKSKNKDLGQSGVEDRHTVIINKDWIPMNFKIEVEPRVMGVMWKKEMNVSLRNIGAFFAGGMVELNP